LDEDEEYLKRYYRRSELTDKLEALTEYYKYHVEIPRIFIEKIYSPINRFHDQKRRLEYMRIK